MTAFVLLSHHRSGSNFLTDTLQSDRRVVVVDEPMSSQTGIFPTVDLDPWSASDYDRVSGHVALESEPASADLVTQLFYYLNGVHVGARGFKETGLFRKIGWLREAVPTLRFLVLFRHPVQTVMSVMAADMDVLRAYRKSHARNGLISRHGRMALIADGWAFRYASLLDDLSGVDGVTWLSLESSVADPAGFARRICSSLDLEYRPEMADFIDVSRRRTARGVYSTFRAADDVSRFAPLTSVSELIMSACGKVYRRMCEFEARQMVEQ